MTMEIVSDVASLDVELLQLPEVSTMGLKSNFTFVQTLYNQWLSLPETNRLVCVSFPVSLFRIHFISLLSVHFHFGDSNSNWLFSVGNIIAK